MPTVLGDLYLDGPAPVYIGTVEGDVHVDGNPVTIGSPVQGDIPEGRTICAKDVRPCPDGSYVSRRGPNCEFAPCPPAEGFSSSVNQRNEAAREDFVGALADTYLTGAVLGILAAKAAIEDRMFDEDLAARVDAVSKAREVPAVPPPPAPSVSLRLAFVPVRTPGANANLFLSMYGGRLSGLDFSTLATGEILFRNLDASGNRRVYDVSVEASANPEFGGEVVAVPSGSVTPPSIPGISPGDAGKVAEDVLVDVVPTPPETPPTPPTPPDRPNVGNRPPLGQGGSKVFNPPASDILQEDKEEEEEDDEYGEEDTEDEGGGLGLGQYMGI